MRVDAKDFEAYGWAMAAVELERGGIMLDVLDLVDRAYTALEAGRTARRNGLLAGECPHGCPALRTAWCKGWQQVDQHLRSGPKVVVLLS